jgi:transglutaminase-like putative cysteine protease
VTFAVVHRTTYAYDAPVSASYGEAHLLPRDLPGQHVLSARIEIDPVPDEQADRLDWFGNRTTWFALHRPHDALHVTATSTVEVLGTAPGQLLADQPWEVVRDALGQVAAGSGAPPDPDLLAAVPFALDSPQLPRSAAAAAFALPSFRPGRPILEAVLDLTHRIHRDFDFEPGATAVGTPVEAVLARRAGVCQDFAHLAVAALRSVGLAARYVSGYLETDPPPGQPKLQGADVSHAWASVHVPQTGWVDVDPTNDQLVGGRYVTVGWGRDYGDVAPLKGVIFTDGDTTSLEVAVDVRRVAAPVAPPPRQQAQQQQQTEGPAA